MYKGTFIKQGRKEAVLFQTVSGKWDESRKKNLWEKSSLTIRELSSTVPLYDFSHHLYA